MVSDRDKKLDELLYGEKINELLYGKPTHKFTPTDAGTTIYPFSEIEPHKLLTEVALSYLNRGACPQCQTNRVSDEHFVLVGRSDEGPTEYSSTPFTRVRKWKFRYEGCYLPICKNCFWKHKRYRRLASFLAGVSRLVMIPLAIVWGVFSDVFHDPTDWEIYSFFIAWIGSYWLLKGAAIYILFTKRFLASSESLSKGCISTNSDFPNIGVPISMPYDSLFVGINEKDPRPTIKFVSGIKEFGSHEFKMREPGR